ncbi:flagellin [Desulfurivibrio alkaliphilus]|uniref:Flagellin n=1 Tax=Desulfurivibrio alkaliphilus (strain DSM 19089 / UNIQEM U267 / AHT2) TaxID=589865 RepID=D6Z320_DESAT|nr:flagellin [Desulfurivibrio alkaliphilus]ADH85945.1 flagellin domain protein [Desulfurivibrio alkaliphilus AHT 2]
MSLKINTDINSMFALGSLQKIQQGQAASLAKIGSGRRIVGAADDAAGLQIANLLKSQALGAGQSLRNAADSIAMTQIADGALGQGSEILMSILEKALQAASAAQSPESRQAIQADINRLLGVYNEIAGTTTFAGQRVLGEEVRITMPPAEPPDGAPPEGVPAEGAEDRPEGLIPGGIDVTTREGAEAAVGAIDSALVRLSTMRGEFGARQNQLVSEMAGLSSAAVNIWSAHSQVADVDLAEETMNLARINMLRQSGLFALTQGMNLNQTQITELLQGKP